MSLYFPLHQTALRTPDWLSQPILLIPVDSFLLLCLVINYYHGTVYHFGKQAVLVIDMIGFIILIQSTYYVGDFFAFRERVSFTHFKMIGRLHSALRDGLDGFV